MEKQRSFSIKPTRFLVFSFTISFSLIFLTSFTIWVLNISPPIGRETHFLFNKRALNLDLKKPLSAQGLAGFSSDFSSILIGTQFLRPGNGSEFVSGSNSDGLPGRESEEATPASAPESNEETTEGVHSGVRNSILIGTQVLRPGNGSDFVSSSNPDGLPGRESEEATPAPESNEEPTERDVHSGNSTIFNSNLSVNTANNSILLHTQFIIHENTSGLSRNSDFESIKRGNEEELYIEHSRTQNISDSSLEKTGNLSEKSCDLTKGKWMFDESYPLYTNGSCPFIDEGFNCEANGRFDKDYMKWRWQPQDCDIPRFNATNFLELIEGKRLVFVGDSINRNQWESMLCLLMGAIKDPRRVYETRGRKITKEKGNYSFKFVDYKCTIEYYVTHFLVHETKARVGKKRVQTLRIDAVDKGSSRWKGADVLVFNTAHWWNHHKTKAGINYYQEKDQVHPRLEASTAFQRAMTTWASWVDKNINPRKTQVFFRSSSPSHFRGGQWNEGGHCQEASRPINKTLEIRYSEKSTILGETIRQMKTPVIFLNVTRLSGYRIDGHPSVYGRKKGAIRSGVQDCSHWCLPGVPGLLILTLERLCQEKSQSMDPVVFLCQSRFKQVKLGKKQLG